MVVTWAFMLGVIFSVADWTNATRWGAVGITAAALLFLALFAYRFGSRVGAVLIAALWSVAVVAQLQQSDHGVAVTIGLPFVLTAIAVAVLRPRRIGAIVRSSPLVLPVALSVLVIPLFTADLWNVVTGLHVGNLMLVAGLTVLPLLFSVRRRLSREVGPALQDAREAIDADLARTALEGRLTKLLDEFQRPGAEAEIHRLLTRFWIPFDATLAAKEAIDPLRRQLGRNLFVSATGLMIVASCYMGALAWALVPVANAQAWTGHDVDDARIELLGITAHVPLGPYVVVASLLGLLATAVMLASVAMSEDYARRLAEALLRQPAETALATVVPYLRMSKEKPAKRAIRSEERSEMKGRPVPS